MTVSSGSTYFIGVILASSGEIHINGVKDPASSDDYGSPTFANNNYSIFIGADYEEGAKFNGKIHAVAMWYGELLGDNFTKIHNDGNLGFDLTQDSADGKYNQASNLKSWWKLGEDDANIGKDFGPNSIFLDGASMDTSNVVTYP